MTSGTLLTEQDMKEFRAEYGELIRQQCVSLMGETKAARELEERVLLSIREKYEYQPLPAHCETMLIARCCILSSRMESPDMEEEPGEGAETPAAPAEKAPAVQPSEKTPAVSEAETPAALADVSPSSPAATEAGTVGETENIPEEIRNIRVTAAYDPEKTTLWVPDGKQPDRIHLQKDPEDPEEAAGERSVPHSIFNTFLVLIFLGSIGFFMWKTGLLRLAAKFLEGLFIYG